MWRRLALIVTLVCGISSAAVPASNQFSGRTGAGGGSGDVSGPGSATSGHIASYNGPTGKVIQDSGVAVSSVLVSGGALGTPSSATLTNATGLPITGIAGLGTGIATWLATPSFTNLNLALTGKSVAASDLSNVTLAGGDCTNSGLALTCLTLNGTSPGNGFGLTIPTASMLGFAGGAYVDGEPGTGFVFDGSNKLQATVVKDDCTLGACNTNSVSAGSFVVSTSYVILVHGTTDFTAIGAANNNPGTVFTATGAGSGTGVASPTGIIPSGDNNKLVLLGAHAYTVAQAGTGAFTAGWGLCPLNDGTTGDATITATTSVFNGAGGTTLLTLEAGGSACISSDGTNYTAGVSHYTGDGPAITPTALSGDVNDYNPTGLAAARTILLGGGSSDRNITGIAGGWNSRVLRIINVGATNNLVLKNNSSSSAAANRMLLVGDITLKPNAARLLIYDQTAASGTGAWRQGAAALENIITAGTYGSASAIPSLTIGVDGRVSGESDVTAAAPSLLGASPANHSVPVDVGGTSTYKAVPNCTDTGGNHLNYTQSTDAFSCGTTSSGGGGSTVLTSVSTSELDCDNSGSHCGAGGVTLTAIPGMSVSLTAGKTYACHFYFPSTVASSTGGGKFSLDTTDTLTMTSMSFGVVIGGGSAVGVVTALATGIGAGGASSAFYEANATLVVNAGGTLVPKFCQNTGNATQSKILVNSHMTCAQM